MDTHGHALLIKDVIVFLIAAGIVVPALRAVKIPTVAGFLLAGILLGPYGLAQLSVRWPILEYFTLSDIETAKPFAELGVLTLLFLLGLELSFEKLWAWRRIVFGAGLLQVTLSTVLIASACSLAGLGLTPSILIGLALALSSTAVVMQLLTTAHQAATPIGRTALGILLLQDILVAPILIFAGFMDRDIGGDILGVLSQALLEGLLAIAGIFIVGRFLLRRLFHLAVQAGGRDFLLAITLLTVVGAAVASGSAGLSIALGAFLAGLLLGETEFKHQTEVDLEPFKGLLLGLFFVTVGMSMNLAIMKSEWALVLTCVAGLWTLKAIANFISIRLTTGRTSTAIEAGLLLAPAGEFAFVILASVGMTGILEESTSTLVTAVAGLSMLLTPVSWIVGQKLAQLLQKEEDTQPLPDALSKADGHIIIAGFGRVGHSVARILEQENATFIALDNQASLVNSDRRYRKNVFIGDAGREEVLNSVGLSKALMLIVTLDSISVTEKIVRLARKKRPAMPIVVRARDAEHADRVYKAGATFVVPDAVEAGLQMSARALTEIGYQESSVRDLIAAHRQESYVSFSE